MKKITLAILSVLISTGCNATTYETADEGAEHQWRIYDQRPKGANITHIYDEDKDSQVIELSGKGIRNGYVIGGWSGNEAWDNSEETIAQWSMNFSERFVVYFHIETSKGSRYLYYTANNKNWGANNSGHYIHHGLGKEAKNGTWQSFSRDLQADLQEYEADNEIIAVNGFFIRGSGKVDDIELVQPKIVMDVKTKKEQRLIADQFISIFENGSTDIEYDYAENIGDGRGITAGRAGFTSATGDMLIVINKYTKLKPDNSLAQYTDELAYLVDLRYNVGDRKGSASTKNLGGLVEAWKEHSQYQVFKDIQDEVVDEMYFDTAVEKAKSIGATLPLSLLCLYDANIMHGESGLEELVSKTNQQMNAKGDFDEVSWITKFNAVRKKIMLSDSSWKDATTRVDELDDLIESKNYQLSPFKMVIENYEDETHYLPAY
jgi:chitosanase